MLSETQLLLLLTEPLLPLSPPGACRFSLSAPKSAEGGTGEVWDLSGLDLGAAKQVVSSDALRVPVTTFGMDTVQILPPLGFRSLQFCSR